MSAALAFDRYHDGPPDIPAIEFDDPIRRLFVDRALPGGARLLAMAEPVHCTPGGYVTAATALVAFEEALAVAIVDGVEAGLNRAFGAANTAVRSVNHNAPVGKRDFAGITAIVIAGEHAIIGCVPPGQALLLQDERLYGVPELGSWSPAHMPNAGREASEPLGLALFARPILRRTLIGAGDQVVLGSSAIGRVMADIRPPVEASRPEPRKTAPVIHAIEHALERSGVEDAYAAWVRVGASDASLAASERPSMVDRGRALRGADPASQSTVYVDPRLRRAQRFDRFHGRLIEASERLLGGREDQALPLDARRRASAPPGASALERHVQRHQLSLGPTLRCRLPRGPRFPVSRRSLLALFVVLTMIAGAALGYDVRQARADKQDRHFNTARVELLRANQAAGDDDVRRHIALARQALDEAADNDADPAVIAQWREQADAVEDRLNDVHRIKGFVQIGTLPSSIVGESPRLVHAGDHLYLVANGVYVLDAANLRMVQLLKEGDKIGRITAGRITDATADGSDLIVTDGRSLFRRTPDGHWSAERLAESASSEGWISVACGIFRGGLYLLEVDGSPQIKKFGATSFSREPVNWAEESAIPAIANGIDMVVDGSIYVLTGNGTIYELLKGKVHDERSLDALGTGSRFIGMDRGAVTSALFVIEANGGDARLTRIDPESGEAIHFLPQRYDAAGADRGAAAFASATGFVVDEATGFVYVLSRGELWRGSLS